MGTLADVVHYSMMNPEPPRASAASAAQQPLTMSDENAKTEIKPANKPVADFFATIGAHEYEYKNSKHGEGKFVSPMAQELEKTVIGKSAVIDTPEGKKVDYPRLTGVALAGLALHHSDLKKLTARVDALVKVSKRKSNG